MEGSNGSGKTTLLKIISGITPFEGSVSFNGIDLKKSPVTYRKHVAYAEAEPLYPPMLTGNELIRFVQRTRNDASENIQALVSQFNIGHFMNRAVGTYSSGMLKKLSLLLAFIGKPTLILLDEPLITLDTAFIEVLLTVIRQKQAADVSFIVTSHQPFTENTLLVNGHLHVHTQTVNVEVP
jgi:ABC-2 type transport system ATP-binding protein